MKNVPPFDETCGCGPDRPPRGWALITGASSGLGRALAVRCYAGGWGVILVARREDLLRDLAAELTGPDVDAPATPPTPPRVLSVPLDLALPDALDRLEAAIAAAGLSRECVTLLLNNAGVGDHGLFLDLTPGRREEMIALNVAALTRLAHFFAPHMRPGATICNIASVAAFTPGPLMAVYYATKAYALSLGQALHQELRPRGVRVVTACPGPFRSEFHGRAGIGGASAPGSAGRLPSAERVADRVLAAVRRGRAVAPLGAAAWIWAVLGPRLPRGVARRFIRFLQDRRRCRCSQSEGDKSPSL
ncbi:MAG: SDR family NAD(P)-dependent oxidoreductase [Spirochaetaceae bacterium]|nr:MAG: SDR family NAD(P)-dependent oxidoreductase [Spirochaetaceae bacterium]